MVKYWSREPSTVNDIIDIIEDDQAHEEESATDSTAHPSKSVGKRKQAECEFFYIFWLMQYTLLTTEFYRQDSQRCRCNRHEWHIQEHRGPWFRSWQRYLHTDQEKSDIWCWWVFWFYAMSCGLSLGQAWASLNPCKKLRLGYSQAWATQSWAIVMAFRPSQACTWLVQK